MNRRLLRCQALLIAGTLLLSCHGTPTTLRAYRWVVPPAGSHSAAGARGANSSYILVPRSQGFFLPTPDGQASIQFPTGVVKPVRGEGFFVISIRPLDPLAAGPPPIDTKFEGNAYAIEGHYRGSGAPIEFFRSSCTKTAALEPCPIVTIVYPDSATRVLRKTKAGWTLLEGKQVSEVHTFILSTTQMGTFVAASALTR